MHLLVSLFAHKFKSPIHILGVIPLAMGVFIVPRECLCESEARRIRFEIDVQGTLQFNPDGRGVQSQPMKAYGEISFDQKLQGTGREVYAARHYRQARAVATIGKSKIQRTLRPICRTVGVASSQTGINFRPLTGSLTRDELDLLETQFDPLYLPELLSFENLRIGAKAEPAKALLASLLLVDVVHQSDVVTQVVEMDDSTATIRIEGRLSAAADGVSSEIAVAGRLYCALDSKELIRFAITVAEKRSIGHAAPGFDLTATIKATLSPLPDSPHLSAQTLARLEKQFENNVSLVSYSSEQLGLHLLHDPRWTVVLDRPETLVMRMVDRGDLIGQCNVSRLANLSEGEQVSLDAFKADVKQALADSFGEYVEASSSATEQGNRVLRVTVRGMVSELSVTWIYYLVGDANGGRASLVFTFASELAEEFAESDRALVSSLRFASLQPTTASSSGDAKQAAARNATSNNRQ